MPTWYLTLRAARYLSVPPWELNQQPLVWKEHALAGERAELEAQRILEARRRRREKRKGGG